MTQASPNWYETFFSGVALDFWDRVAGPEMTKPEAAFLLRELNLPSGGEVLDVPCGSGRLSFAMAAAGHRPTGIDISAENIHRATAKAERDQLPVDFRQGDMRELPGERRFDGAFCWGNSFGYLDDAGNERFLAAVHRSLKPGARFVLDAAAGESVFTHLKHGVYYEVGDILFLLSQKYAAEEGRLYTEYTFVQNNVVDRRHGNQRIYTFRQLQDLLRNAGFKLASQYGGLNEEPFGLGSPRCLFVAEA